MTTQELNDKVLEKYAYVFRNNRGVTFAEYKGKKRIIRYGIPTPRAKEKDTDFKGGDFIGMNYQGKFLNIEVKGDGDKLKMGQVKWHNLIIRNGGCSEIWLGDGTVIDSPINFMSKELKKWR